MEQKIILACVIIISLIAHVWIYRWIKFKMDEGAILRYLNDLSSEELPIKTHLCTTEKISETLAMKHARIVFVCEKSKDITFKDDAFQLISKVNV